MKTPPTTLADRLVMARGKTGLQQDAVAKGARMSQQSYSDLETGKSKSTVKIGSLARVLGVDAYWLETGEGEMRVGEQRETYISPDHMRLLDWLGTLSEKQRKGLMQFLQIR